MIAEEFFRERLGAALDSMRRPVSPEATEYLVGVLAGYVCSPLDLEMMGYRYLACLGPDRIVVLKEVGDASLFLLGFFAESRRVRFIGPGYYADLGRSAYGELGNRFRGDGGRVFGELCGKFPVAREALGRVRAGLSMDPLDAHKEWIRNRSEASEQALRRSGLLVG